MKHIATCFFSAFIFCACSSGPDRSDSTQTSENEIDAARNFIGLALDGKWDDARGLIVDDSLNNTYLDLAQRNYQQRLDLNTKIQYRNASINIHSVNTQGDSVSVVHYANSYKKQPDSVKVVKYNSRWLVDLKYSFPATKAVQ